MRNENDIIAGVGEHLSCNEINNDNLASSLMLMNVLEFIKEHKIPQKEIAELMDISYYMFRKKTSGTQVQFSESEIEQMKVATKQYIENLLKKFHKKVN